MEGGGPPTSDAAPEHPATSPQPPTNHSPSTPEFCSVEKPPNKPSEEPCLSSDEDEWEVVGLEEAEALSHIPLKEGEYEGCISNGPLRRQLVFGSGVVVAAVEDLKKRNLEAWSYCLRNGQPFINAVRHTSTRAVYHYGGKDGPFATVESDRECVSFMVRDQNFDPYVTLFRKECISFSNKFVFDVYKWAGNQKNEKYGKAIYKVRTESGRALVKRCEDGKDVAFGVYKGQGRDVVAQGSSVGMIINEGEDVGLMTILITCLIKAKSFIPTRYPGNWVNGTYQYGTRRDSGGGTEGVDMALGITAVVVGAAFS